MANEFARLHGKIFEGFQRLRVGGPILVGPLAESVEQAFAAHGFRKGGTGSQVRQILVLRLDELGDVILTSAFLRELRRNNPTARITLIVNPRWLEAVALSPYLNRVLVLDTLQIQRDSDSLQGFALLLNYARRHLWLEHYDLCIVPRFDHDCYLAGVLALLSGARQRIGYAENVTPWKAKWNNGYDGFYSRLLPGAAPEHEVERNLAMIRTMGGKVGSDKLEVWTGFEDERWADSFLAPIQGPLVVLSPGKTGTARSWPVERYAELAEWLFKECGLKTLVLGTVEETANGQYLSSHLPYAVKDMTGKTTIGQMTALLRHCRLYIGRDTAIKHLSAAVGLPVVEISSCPEGVEAANHFSSPVRFGPWGVKYRIVQPVMVDSGCKGGCRYDQPHCILNITVEQIRRAVAGLLSETVNGPVITGNGLALQDTWIADLRRFDREQTERRKQNPVAAIAAADKFYLNRLKRIQPAQANTILPVLTELWLNHRRLPQRFGAVTPAERERLVQICDQLRIAWELLLKKDFSSFGSWSEVQQKQCVSMWRLLFLSPFSPLALSSIVSFPHATVPAGCASLRECLLSSLYEPHAPANLPVDIQKLMTEAAPAFFKTIVGAWLLGTSYFGVVEADRLRVCDYSSRICEAMLQSVDVLPFGTYAILVEEMMAAFWRVSYAGGDNKRELSKLGDLISLQMNRVFPQEKMPEAGLADNKRTCLRVGYISRNFCKQAVSFYMVNRLIHHDRKRFEIYTFAVGDRDDELTKIFKDNSDIFERYLPLADFSGMIRKLRDSRLDILIYADLGMDPFTLMLAGLRLAPVQCVLVGHGVTSGMPEIDYYISGDFEPADAERYYREKLVRLPNLGASQYPPFEPENYPTRQNYQIPEDAVVYVSCANGIKIHPDQDLQFLKILQQVPKAWLVLKPFQTPDAVDLKYLDRFFVPARAAGVADRILIVPPFRQAQEVLGLLRLADIQLDTYPYGGWTTNMEAVYMGLPIVTQEGDMARSRWGAAILRALGIGEWIAHNCEEYVERAVRLGLDANLREQVRAVIRREARAKFFDGAAAQPAYEEMLRKCYREKTGIDER